MSCVTIKDWTRISATTEKQRVSSSGHLINDAAKREQLPILSASLQFVASYAVNSREISYSPLFLRYYSTVDWPPFCRWQLRPTLIQSRMVSSESHNIRTSGALCGTLTFKVNQAFKVIQGHPYWCQQKSRTDFCHNVQQCRHYYRNLRIASGKLQICRFQPPHSGLITVMWETLEMIDIGRK